MTNNYAPWYVLAFRFPWFFGAVLRDLIVVFVPPQIAAMIIGGITFIVLSILISR